MPRKKINLPKKDSIMEQINCIYLKHRRLPDKASGNNGQAPNPNAFVGISLIVLVDPVFPNLEALGDLFFR